MVELTVGGQSLVEVKIPEGILQEDSFSPLLFIIAMWPLNYVIRKCAGGYKFTKSKEKINYLKYMNDIKVFVINKKITGAQYSQHKGIKFSKEECAML